MKWQKMTIERIEIKMKYKINFIVDWRVNWKEKLIEQKDKIIKIMKIKIEMKNKKIILKSEIKKNNQFNKRQRKNQKNKDQIGQYNISQLELKNVIEKSSEF